jgi:hypothetical protein
MIGDVPCHRNEVRRIHEILFSLNIAFAITLAVRAYLGRFGRGQNVIADFVIRTIGWVNAVFGLTAPNHFGVEFTFLVWIAGIALSFFLFVRFVVPAKAMHAILNTTAGVTSLAAVPTCLLYANETLLPGHVASYRPHLAIEVAGAASCVLLYSMGKWLLPSWCSAVLISLHFVAWAWIIWQLFSPAPLAIFLSAVPPAAGVAWLLYDRGSRPNDVSV